MSLKKGHTPQDQPVSASADAPAAEGRTASLSGPAPQKPEKRKRRRSWKWWLANLMIIAGVLVLAYPAGTFLYTWYEQRELREQLEEGNPGMAAADAARAEGDFISVARRGENAQLAAGSSAQSAAEAAAEAARLAEEQERQAQLDAFRAAADAFAAEVGGKTGTPIGRIIMPSIEVDVVMLEGTSTGDLREGPGHWEETPFPGQGGNFVVSGHRSTYGAPFRKFDKVEEGDIVDLVLPYAVARYAVTRVIIVKPHQVEEVAQRGWEQVSLAACHPMYSARERIVVQGDLIGFTLTEPAVGTPVDDAPQE